MRKKKFLVFRLKLEAKQNPRRLTCGADEYKTIAPHTLDLNKQQLVREYTSNVIGMCLFNKAFGHIVCTTKTEYLKGANANKELLEKKGVVIKHYGNDYYVYINKINVDIKRVDGRKLNYSEVE